MDFNQWWIGRVALALALIGAIGAVAGLRGAAAAPAQQAGPLSCKWTNAGNANGELWDTGSVYNPYNNEMWFYSGLDGQARVSNHIEQMTMTGTAGGPKVSHKTIPAPSLEIFAPACTIRDKGADSDHTAVYCIGGTKNPLDAGGGKGEPVVQRFLVKAGVWETVVPVDGTFTGRWGAAAAYDPVHDVIWVVGGIAQCSVGDILGGETCQARAIPTVYMSFDDATDSRKWNSGGGSENIFLTQPAYDAPNKRVIFIGGSTDGVDGAGYLKQINFSDPDVTKLRVTSLSASGTAPAIFLHGVAYDSTINGVTVYGGVRTGHLRNRETTETRTFVLDLAGATPAWTNIGGATLGDRVGGTMQFDTKQGASIFAVGRKAWTGASSISAVRTTNALTCARATVPTATTAPPTATPGGPTATPRPTGEAPTAVPTTVSARVCDATRDRVPGAVINGAVAAPQTVQGWDQLCFPNQPASPTNFKRGWLNLQNPSLAFHPLFNSVVWRCGCR